MNARESLALAPSASREPKPRGGSITPRQRAYLSKTPSLSVQIVERAFLGTASPRQAIKAKCLSCANWQRDEVEFCAVETCPVWRYRPYQAAGKGAA
jgi:hypothetical protein